MYGLRSCPCMDSAISMYGHLPCPSMDIAISILGDLHVHIWRFAPLTSEVALARLRNFRVVGKRAPRRKHNAQRVIVFHIPNCLGIVISCIPARQANAPSRTFRRLAFARSNDRFCRIVQRRCWSKIEASTQDKQAPRQPWPMPRSVAFSFTLIPIRDAPQTSRVLPLAAVRRPR